MFSPENYLLYKHLHLTLVLLSVGLFVVRFATVQFRATAPNGFWFRVAPHIIDTCLLISGVLLMWVLQLSPFAAGWIALKLVLVVLYILLGLAAMKWAGNNGVRWVFFIAALLTVCAIGALAALKPF